tara:strand:+ start:209 stop:490 length:282 start_codon:yes stop_codon:yes gene_type:complete
MELINIKIRDFIIENFNIVKENDYTFSIDLESMDEDKALDLLKILFDYDIDVFQEYTDKFLLSGTDPITYATDYLIDKIKMLYSLEDFIQEGE